MNFWSFGILASFFIHSLFFDRSLLLIFLFILAAYILAGLVQQRKGLTSVARKTQISIWNEAGQPHVFGRQEIDLTTLNAFIENCNKQNPADQLSLTVLFAKGLAVGLCNSKRTVGRISFGQFIPSDKVNISVFTEIDGKNFARVLLEDCSNQTIRQLDKQLREKSEVLKRELEKMPRKGKSWLDYVPSLLIQSAMRIVTWLNYDWELSLPFLSMKPSHFGQGIIWDFTKSGLADCSCPLVPHMKSIFTCALNKPQQKPVYVEEKLVVKSLLNFNLTFDHRFGDGVDAIKLFEVMTEVLEHPEKHL